ncbi:glucuronyl hydrolase [Pseudoduganella eburnea]|uniref:Glucuronyl hydrolase n=1 Tax=Massilia eburnea TaxID=1776165 RepID=A0A6L6QQS1_9BURK|nr:glycoside hydrolase family 88 protein [Massilia eburnea]MTW14227.1 glucuronyl hydrolase [Massilia eburnea]
MNARPQPCPPALQRALYQLDGMLHTLGTQYPDDTSQHLHYQLRRHGTHAAGANVGWTTGFWPGMLWLGYELTGWQRFRDAATVQAADFARRLQEQADLDHHDLGFLYLLSNVAADRIAALPGARATALAAADRLLARFLPGAGVIQAWGKLDDPKERGRVIVDCVMNLPLLHWASAVTGEPGYREAARSHLVNTRHHLVRPDGSTCHTFFFNADTGEPLREVTHQGLADSSCWSRGQAWALYGFALNHRHLPELGLLDAAMQVADYFLGHLPPDLVALWDLGLAHDSGEPRDSSANAIAACGLLDLASQLPPGPQREHYHAAGERLLDALARHCAAELPAAGGLLTHGTYHRLANLGVEECTLWGDYYYLEALARLHHGWTSYDR